MPRPAHPPTPISSTEIKGLDGFSDSSFELPPSAFNESSSAGTKRLYASSHGSAQPAKAAPRRQLSIKKIQSSVILPPPPSRSRKIIQMKPKGQDEQAVIDSTELQVGKVVSKKRPTATSAAGKKSARKTAHSLIERRRRSKMNEEFGVLKDMIPACTGEMHKLAIIQASIDYVRYLEDCVAKLKAQAICDVPVLDVQDSTSLKHNTIYNKEEADSDMEMEMEIENSQNSSPYHSQIPMLHKQSISPIVLAQDARHDFRQPSYTTSILPAIQPTSTISNARHYSYSSSTTTSPTLDPQRWDRTGVLTGGGSVYTSPALSPQSDDRSTQEATAALLMLNCDRRGMDEKPRGMSVKDLLI